MPTNPRRIHRALAMGGFLLLTLLPGQAQAQSQPEPATIRVAILSLFHATTLTLTPTTPYRLDGTPHHATTLTVHAEAGLLTVTLPTAEHLHAHTLTLPPGPFTITVRGTRTTLTRTYRGALTLTVGEGELRPVLTLPTELAVASVVQAEAAPGTPPEALKAQAIAARSFLLANLHPQAPSDTCDTTHCQLLQSPPAPTSRAAQATRATAHLVLTWQPDPATPPTIVGALWTPTCAGTTRAGRPSNPNTYPFYAVPCQACRTHPDRWTRPLTTPAPTTETARLAWNRTHPDAALPSPTLIRTATAVEGQGTGHGMGLCQRGASAAAQAGRPYTHILAHYFPNTTLTRLP